MPRLSLAYHDQKRTGEGGLYLEYYEIQFRKEEQETAESSVDNPL